MTQYTHQIALFIPVGERTNLGTFMRDYGSQLEGFSWDDDLDMRAVSTDGVGPLDGLVFASWVLPAQAAAFANLAGSLPSGTQVLISAGRGDVRSWLSGFGMEFIEE
jgi:hypothetical protein